MTDTVRILVSPTGTLFDKWDEEQLRDPGEQETSNEHQHEEQASKTTRWPELDDAALYGLPGEITKTIEPHTEAAPVAVLVNLLVACGNVIGRGAYFQVGADRHHLNLNAALVGETSKGRKGSSWGFVRELMHAADPLWSENRVLNGLSSGEGLIHAVQDSTEEQDGSEETVEHESEAGNKRLLIMEGELAGPLKAMTREGNTLSAIIRQAWDGVQMATLTRKSPLRATNAHVSIIGHITKSELTRRLSETDTEGGFTNRFLWLMVRRSKVLPFGGEWHQVNPGPLVERLRNAFTFGQDAGEIRWAESSRELWKTVYGPLSEGKLGLLGAATSRAEAQVIRLAALYAVMDRTLTVERTHLSAALALWSYAEESARYIFGEATGDPVADKIAAALEDTPDGLTRTNIVNLFKRHKGQGQIDQALSLLEQAGRVRRRSESTGGRPVEWWVLK